LWGPVSSGDHKDSKPDCVCVYKFRQKNVISNTLCSLNFIRKKITIVFNIDNNMKHFYFTVISEGLYETFYKIYKSTFIYYHRNQL